MKLILRTTSNNEYFGGCEYAAVDLSVDLAKLALKRIELLKKELLEDNSLWEKYYFDYSAEFFGNYEADGMTRNPLDEIVDPATEQTVMDIVEGDDGLWIVHGRFEIPQEAFSRTECDQMIVHDDSISWMCYPKHTDVEIRTFDIRLGLLEDALSQATPKAGT